MYSPPYRIRTCVAYPYALLLGHASHVNISKQGQSYKVICLSCKITNYIFSSEPKEFSIMLIVKYPSFVMLSMDLKM
ncbi:hypothetical protein LEMLEM_LOCUS4216, partial [Lemmus lemmus]